MSKYASFITHHSSLLSAVEAIALADILDGQGLGGQLLGVAGRAEHEVDVGLAERDDVLEPLELERRLTIDDEGQVAILCPRGGLLLCRWPDERTHVVDGQVLEHDARAQEVPGSI